MHIDKVEPGAPCKWRHIPLELTGATGFDMVGLR